MIFLKAWNYFLGYVVISVNGLSLEKFINLCVSRGIKLWGIRRISYTSLTAKIGIRDFKSLPPIVRRVGCRVKIIDKRGFPFLAYRFRHRKMLIGGMLIFILILYGLSSFVWVVEVGGNTKVDRQVIYDILDEKGVRPGVYKGKLNTWEIENEILIQVPELSWISIELKGSKAIIKLVEGVKPPKLIDKETPCNIIASKDGLIHQLIVLDGQAEVEIGDTVRKGQLLISGIIEHEDTQIVRYVHSRAHVIARTWYEGRAQANFDSVSKTRTGEKASHKFIESKNWIINIKREEIPFEDYEIEERREAIIEDYLGLSWVVREFYEIKDNSTGDREQLAKEMAGQKAMEKALKNIPKEAKIIDKKFKYDIIKDIGYEAIVYIEVLEDIAEQTELLVN
ncbi:MAG: sporulation protein YqfD [Clostridiales bacterium]|nr:sporulation protein YqfD [Clostridiales bacterium]